MSVFNELLKSDKINFKPENARSTNYCIELQLTKESNSPQEIHIK